LEISVGKWKGVFYLENCAVICRRAFNLESYVAIWERVFCFEKYCVKTKEELAIASSS